jgi:hypothetical protein
MMLRPLLVALMIGLTVTPLPALSQTSAETPAADTYDLLRIPELLEVMREEGMGYGETLAGQLFDDPEEPGWAGTVSEIYETGRLARVFRAEFDRMLEGDEATRAAAAAFFEAELGQTILGLEIEARRALLDEPVEEAAALAYEDMADRRDPRVALLEEFAMANDLVEANVAGALNANLAFLKGMAAVGSGPEDTEALLADVRGASRAGAGRDGGLALSLPGAGLPAAVGPGSEGLYRLFHEPGGAAAEPGAFRGLRCPVLDGLGRSGPGGGAGAEGAGYLISLARLSGVRGASELGRLDGSFFINGLRARINGSSRHALPGWARPGASRPRQR